jgi:O-acetylserine/cysteine efflux transporter
MPLRDGLIAMLTVAILGSNFVAIKAGVSELPPLLLTGLRFLFAAIPAVFFIKPPKAPWWIVAAFGFVLGVLQFGSLFTAIHLGMPAGLSSLVLQMQVFFTIGMAFIFFGERPKSWQLAGGVIAACGLAAIASGKAEGVTITPFALVLFAGLSWATANMLTKRAGKVDMVAFVVWSSLISPVPLFILSILIEGARADFDALKQASWISVASLAYLAYPTTILAFSLWNGLLSRHPASTVAPFGLLVPVWGMASTALAFHERLDGAQLAGAALILLGLALNISGGRLISLARTLLEPGSSRE